MLAREHTYQTCIDICLECAAACNRCLASCLDEKDVDSLSKCIQLDMECSAICRTAAQFMSLKSDHSNAVCQLCADVCTACGDECSKHDHMEHCRNCAEICYRCAEECAGMAAA
jgi:hypothetical protein